MYPKGRPWIAPSPERLCVVSILRDVQNTAGHSPGSPKSLHPQRCAEHSSTPPWVPQKQSWWLMKRYQGVPPPDRDVPSLSSEQHHADSRQELLGMPGDGFSSGHPQPVTSGSFQWL